MNKILFPFGLDEQIYREAYVFAVKIARKMYAELILFNTFIIDPEDSLTQESYNLQVRKKWLLAYKEVTMFHNNYLEKYAKVKEEFEVHHSYKFIHGRFLPEFKKAINDEQVDLVILPVIADKERNKKLLQILHDDIFEKNAASALVFPEGQKFTPVKNILFATDLKKLKNHDQYLNDVLKYAGIFNAKIHFLHVTPSDKPVLPEDASAYRTMMNIIESDKKHIFKSVHGKQISNSIQDYSIENEIDLLVTVKHEHRLMESIFHKSTSDELVLNSGVPVMVMREKEDN